MAARRRPGFGSRLGAAVTLGMTRAVFAFARLIGPDRSSWLGGAIARTLGPLFKPNRIARETGLNHVYVGNVHHAEAQSSYCSGCGVKVIGRDWHELSEWQLTHTGACTICDTPFPGVFNGPPGNWGRKRQPVRIV